MPHERITVTLPKDVIRDIDQQENNRSRFVLLAIKRELERRRREDLRQSLLLTPLRKLGYRRSGDRSQGGDASPYRPRSLGRWQRNKRSLEASGGLDRGRK